MDIYHSHGLKIAPKMLIWKLFLPDQDEMRNFYVGLHMFLYHLKYYLDFYFQSRRFVKFQPIRKKNAPWRSRFRRIKTKWDTLQNICHTLYHLAHLLDVQFQRIRLYWRIKTEWAIIAEDLINIIPAKYWFKRLGGEVYGRTDDWTPYDGKSLHDHLGH